MAQKISPALGASVSNFATLSVMSRPATSQIVDAELVSPTAQISTETQATATIQTGEVAPTPIISTVGTVAEITPILTTTISPNLNDQVFFNPDLIDIIGHTHHPHPGVPRDQVTTPVSPSAGLSDDLLYEAAANPSQKFYLARYRIGLEQVSGQQQVRVVLGASGNGWSLTIHLEKYPSPSLANGSAQELLPNGLDVILKHRLLLNGQPSGEKELAFQELTSEQGGLYAVLSLATPAERDSLYLALTDPIYGASLTIRRTINVAIPIDVSEDGEQLYRVVSRPLDQVVDSPNPFVFPPNLNPNVFGGILPGNSQGFGLKRLTVDLHNYYQDGAQGYLFYYLPDSFKIARTDDSPHVPAMSIRFTSDGDSIDSVNATLDYVAAPVVDLRRLEAAAESLKAFMPAQLPPGINHPMFAPLPAGHDQVRFRLALPKLDGSLSGMETREDALVGLGSGIVDSVARPLEAFQTIFDAMMGGSEVLLNGEVVVAMPGEPEEKVPFTGRMNDLVGEMFEYKEVPGDLGAVDATLRCAIESPVRIERLSAELHQGGAKAAASIQSLTLPLQMNPGDQTSFEVVPSSPLGGVDPIDAVFDLSGVKALPDREAILAAVIDPNTQSTYPRKIEVKTFKAMFDADPASPDQQIMAIVVNFDGSDDAVELNPDQLDTHALLHLPILDYLSRLADKGVYRYKLTVIRKHGQARDADWRKDSTPLLFPDVA